MMMVPASTKFVNEKTGEPVVVVGERGVRQQPTTAGQKQLGTGIRQLGY